MQVEQKRRLLEQSLERVVEQIGDITQPTMARYYGRFPAAVEAFERLWTGNRAQLEGEMVEHLRQLPVVEGRQPPCLGPEALLHFD